MRFTSSFFLPSTPIVSFGSKGVNLRSSVQSFRPFAYAGAPEVCLAQHSLRRLWSFASMGAFAPEEAFAPKWVSATPLEQFELVAAESFFLSSAAVIPLLLLLVGGLGVLSRRVQFLPTLPAQWGFEGVVGGLRSLLVSNGTLAQQGQLPLYVAVGVLLLLYNGSALFPYAFTFTAHAVITLFLAFTLFFGLNLRALLRHRFRYLSLFAPAGTPLALLPLLVMLELTSYFIRPFSLAIRLFANLMAGHALLKILVSFAFAALGGGVLSLTGGLLGLGVITAVLLLETLVAGLQVFVFLTLFALYLVDVHVVNHLMMSFLRTFSRNYVGLLTVGAGAFIYRILSGEALSRFGIGRSLAAATYAALVPWGQACRHSLAAAPDRDASPEERGRYYGDMRYVTREWAEGQLAKHQRVYDSVLWPDRSLPEPLPLVECAPLPTAEEVFVQSPYHLWFIPPLLLFGGVLLFTAAFTLLERKVMGLLQRREGPDRVGFEGLGQPFADGLKLLSKETLLPKDTPADRLFALAPLLSLWVSLTLWLFLPFGPGGALVDSEVGLLLLLGLSSLGSYGVIYAGWASNNKYALLGALRAVASFVSYEIVFSILLLPLLALNSSAQLSLYVLYQHNHGWWFHLLPFGVMAFVVLLAETNRTPFDLPEAEAELVAGFNVEYSGLPFAFFFLGEYAAMGFFSALLATLFGGGWSWSPLGIGVNPLDRGWDADAIYTPLLSNDFFCELHRAGAWPRLDNWLLPYSMGLDWALPITEDMAGQRLESLKPELQFHEVAPSRLLWYVRGGCWEDTLSLSLPFNFGGVDFTLLQGLLWVGLPLLVLAIKTQLICLLFVVVRAALPRLRFDQLLALNWKFLFPLAFGLVLLQLSLLQTSTIWWLWWLEKGYVLGG